MRIWPAAIAAVMLGFGAQGATAADAPNCALKQYDSLPLEVDPNRLLVPVSFGTTPEKLVLRLDDASSGISSDTAKAMDFYVTSVPPNIHITRDNDEVTRIAHVRDVHLGHQTINDMEFLMLRPERFSND